MKEVLNTKPKKGKGNCKRDKSLMPPPGLDIDFTKAAMYAIHDNNYLDEYSAETTITEVAKVKEQ